MSLETFRREAVMWAAGREYSIAPGSGECVVAERSGQRFDLCGRTYPNGSKIFLDRRTGDVTRQRPLLLVLAMLAPFVYSLAIYLWYAPNGPASRREYLRTPD